jgi:hypothetical protein
MVEAVGTSPVPVPLNGEPQTPLGRLLMERGLLSDEQLQYALQEQTRTGLPLGQVLVGLSYVTAATIAQALATQHGGLLKTEYGFATGFDAEIATGPAGGVPPVSPAHASVSLRTAAPPPAPLAQPAPPAPPAPPTPVLTDPEVASATSRIAALETELAAARDAAARVESLELEIASARQAEQTARHGEQLARMELAAAQASAPQLSAATARVAELEGEVASARRAEQASRQGEQLARMELAAAQAAIQELSTAAARIAELEGELAAARHAEQAARQNEQLARQELAATQALGQELGAAAGRIAQLESELSLARDESTRITSLELELASARQAEQAARQGEQLARMELAAQSPGHDIDQAAARIAELGAANDELQRQLAASIECSAQIEQRLAEALRAAYARIQECGAAAPIQQA